MASLPEEAVGFLLGEDRAIVLYPRIGHTLRPNYLNSLKVITILFTWKIEAMT